MTRRVRIEPDAEAEVAAAATWYESKRSGLGAEFVAAVDEALDRIATAPQSFPVWSHALPFRRLVLERFPFLVFFTEADDGVIVWAVAHCKRRPGYWLSR